MKQLGVKVHNETRCDAEVTGFKKYNPQGVICAGGEKEQDTCTVSTLQWIFVYASVYKFYMLFFSLQKISNWKDENNT